MKKSRLYLLVLLLALAGLVRIFLFPGRQPVQIYYPEKNNLFLVPVTRWVRRVTPETLFNELKKPPKKRELLPALPDTNLVLNLALHGNVLTVQFKKNPPLEKWPLLLKAILATMKQQNQAETVRFSVRGSADVVTNGLELGSQSLHSFWVNDNLSGGDPGREFADEGRAVTTYYLLKGTQILLPVTQHVPLQRPVEQAIAETLKETPPFSWALSSPLPPGFHLVSVSRRSENRIELFFEFAGSQQEKDLARTAILLTYTEIPRVGWVNVREKGIFWKGIWASKRPAIINREDL